MKYAIALATMKSPWIPTRLGGRDEVVEPRGHGDCARVPAEAQGVWKTMSLLGPIGQGEKVPSVQQSPPPRVVQGADACCQN